MGKVRVKICGITNIRDARCAWDAGCDALGFVFYRGSPRSVTLARAKRIISLLPKGVVKVGVFVNAREKTVRRAARACALDMLQFHGEETPAFCRRFKGMRVIKAFRVKGRIALEEVRSYPVSAYLFDAYAAKARGGTGTRCDWRELSGRRALHRPVFLAGGLDEKNVRRAIRLVRPEWVDASSGLERSPGIKDPVKVKRFVAAVKKASR